ncbi:MAG: alanine--tRNA ligase [bacterium]
MNSTEIRKSFLSYFEHKDHRIIQSDSLIPSSDPTLLFTSAGMVQFKKHFLGELKSDYSRAVSCQKCFRTSDIDQIGMTARHLTFFEMLGNFSFGDYFKSNAISWGWEYLTEVLKLDKKNLYASVFFEDDESYEIWKKILPAKQIIKLGEESNFWNMGPTGPCGPCSEILYDTGKNIGCKKDTCWPGCDCDRYLEVWNLVFTQFDRLANNALKPLPKKNIDTGMGFERLVSVVQGVSSPFDTDLFKPIFEEISSKTGISSSDKNYLPRFRLIADHLRAITFLISDGILPSNEGRGYVLRRIMRRAVRAGKQLNLNIPFLYSLTPVVSSIMKNNYPELFERRENISSIVKLEEEKFHETLETGMHHFNDFLSAHTGIIPGTEVFKLYDTFGFPIELTREIAAESKRSIDEDGFHKAMKKAQEISRKNWKGSGEEDLKFLTSMHKKYGDTVFIGYEHLTGTGKIIALIKDQSDCQSLHQDDEALVILDQTPCYGESGGQAGDTGIMYDEKTSTRVIIEHTIKPISGFIVHHIKIEKGDIHVGDTVSVEVDKDKRLAIMRHHTTTHLLHKALRQVLGKHVVQSGSLVSAERFRFDYTHPGTPKKDEISRIEEIVNDSILMNLSVNTSEITLNEARKLGVTAIFGEKYGSNVRCVYVGDSIKNAFSAELCGGTHMSNTGGIGFFKIISDTSIASGVRRIEAVSGKKAFEYIKQTENLIASLTDKLKVNQKDILLRIDKLIQNQKTMEKEISSLKNKILTKPSDAYAKNMQTIDNLKVLLIKENDLAKNELRSKIDFIKDTVHPDIALLSSGVSYVIISSKQAQDKQFDAPSIIKKFNSYVGGSGGGRKDFAQGGCKDPSLIDQGIQKLQDFIKETQ